MSVSLVLCFVIFEQLAQPSSLIITGDSSNISAHIIAKRILRYHIGEVN
jgi:hypothetical protein